MKDKTEEVVWIMHIQYEEEENMVIRFGMMSESFHLFQVQDR